MDLVQRATSWMQQDPDPETQAELQQLIAASDTAAITDRFARNLEFGTAGLRAELGAGPNRMNRIVVARAARGIASFLHKNKKDFLDSDGELSVVIGYDARHKSDIFAQDSAEIIQATGIRVLLFEMAVPTPVVAFTGKKLSASAAIMVTASHNPPRDNGYKVFLGGLSAGSQLNSPHDAEISAEIAEVTQNFDQIEKSKAYQLIGQDHKLAYVLHTASLAGWISNGSDLRIVYTALHGVGWATLQPVFSHAGLTTIDVVESQIEPDPNFPTVSFPNPEEPGALDLSFQEAEEFDADLIIANDPDADRLAVALKSETGWYALTGDQVGILLADYLAREMQTGTLVNSIVSSTQLQKIAHQYQLEYEATLTGFKWISKASGITFGYEEALGYCIDPKNTPDKDGISAALMICKLAAALKPLGKTLADRLNEIGETHGFTATGQISIRFDDVTKISQLIDSIRTKPPEILAGKNVIFDDLKYSKTLPPSNMLKLVLEDGRRVLIRPSGTEPKLKCYLEASAETYQQALIGLEELKAVMASYLE